MARKPTFGGMKPTKKIATQKPKNTLGAAANKQAGLTALRIAVRMRLTYDGLPRVVEVHTIGLTKAGRPAMSVYQVDGQSHSQPMQDWRLMCFDECFNVALTDLPSAAPRTDYRKGAKQFKSIEAEI